MIEDHPGIRRSIALAALEMRRATVSMYEAAKQSRPLTSREAGQVAYALALGAGVIGIIDVEINKSPSNSSKQEHAPRDDVD